MTIATAPTTTEVLLFALAPAESSHLQAIAEKVAISSTRLLDDPRWVASARETSCHLPLRLSECLREFRADPGRSGVLRISGTASDTTRSTPCVKQSVERWATVPATTIVLCGAALGELMAFRAEKSGALVQNVVPVPGSERAQSNAGSTELHLHVENAFHPLRPDYVLLSCLRQDHDGTAGLQVSSIRNARELLSDRAAQVLRQPRFRTQSPPSFGGFGSPVTHPVLTGAREDPDIRVDLSATEPADPQAAAALTELAATLQAVQTSMVLERGDVAIIDNRVAVHGRTPFVPRYDGQDRWLHRVFVHIDSRRLRSARTGDGYVVD